MNKIDFSHTGGFELTQDILDFLQEANIAAVSGLAAAFGAGPTAVSGLVHTEDVYNSNISSGWLLHAGEMYYCAGGSIADGDLGPG